MRPAADGEPQTHTRVLSYEQFRTGLTYYDVYHLIFGRKFKRRHGVLGAWREIKVGLYTQYLESCSSEVS